MDPWRKLTKLSKDELRNLQNKKLQHFVSRYLYPFSPYYQKLFDRNKIDPRQIRTVEDLARVPLSSKTDFLDLEGVPPGKFREFILQPDQEKMRKHWPAPELLLLKGTSIIRGAQYVKDKSGREFRPIFITYTTGTTHKPVPFLYTKYDIDNLYTSGARMLKLFGVKDTDSLVNMFPYAPHLAFWQVVWAGLSSCVMILSTGGGKVMGTEGNIAVLEKMQPSLILGVPSYVYHVLRLMKERGCRLESLKKIVLGASKVADGFKVNLAEMLESMGAKDVSVMGTYGFTEARAAWTECPTSNDVSSGYHLYPDKEIFEVVDPETGEVRGEGEDGELVYTTLDARASSVMRYRTGDFVKGGITYEPCPYCGSTVPRISSDIVRTSNIKDMQMSKVKGSLVNFNNFSAVLSEFREIEEWQIELCKKDDDPFEVDQLMVYITSREGVNEDALAESVKKQLLLATEVSPNTIKFIPLGEMVKRLELETANKEKRILDRRPEA